MTGGPFDPLLFVAAFAGGAFGAAVGALPSFALTGALVIAGELYAASVRAAGATPALAVTSDVAFGPVFGPHVAFGGGAAAVAYLAARGEGPTGTDYHPAKEITTPLGVRPDVLAVGGAFGVVGHLIAGTAGVLSLPLDPVALGVVGSALAHRAAFGYSVVGAFAAGPMDMSPYERGEHRDVDGEATADGGPRLAVEPWLPHQYRWRTVVPLGAAVGVAAAALAYVTASAFLGFGLSAASLALVVAGVERTPVTHHVTLPASTVVIALAPASADPTTAATLAATVPLPTALLAGAVAGTAGALAGEACQRVLYAHAETHFDPPAASIVLTTLSLAALAALGALPSAAWIPVP